MVSTARDPEQLLSQALRAQAVSGGSGTHPAEAAPPRRRRHEPRPLRWTGWLLILLVGLLAGTLAGLVSLL
ncbi:MULTISPECIES: hypothetical protein [Actinoalloteichus]|uniref:Uncharacterized protein n=1 Tax=Actinoalloteichus fjordicus TaxID=1612552 RepID=A0AAC9LIC4_9PSEU|nr:MULTISPECIES: hypothetical protein [Actinoalloteichus]APU17891.1 hypothetical protein UA74_29495 [Actinoalloteichus fjordicus]APU23969.1 hypothetical protein UA75_30025 [Actinoalloteichus sp. GBA129-24]